jgi:hypothetical protein
MSELLQDDDPEPQPGAEESHISTMTDLCNAASLLLDGDRATGPHTERRIQTHTGEILSRSISDGAWRFRYHGDGYDAAWDLGDADFRQPRDHSGLYPDSIIEKLKVFDESTSASSMRMRAERSSLITRFSLRRLIRIGS